MMKQQWTKWSSLAVMLMGITACNVLKWPNPNVDEVSDLTTEVEMTPGQTEEAKLANQGIRRVTLASLDVQALQEVAEPGTELPDVEPLELQGDIVIAGSSTVFPITEQIVNQFTQDGYPNAIAISGISDTEGFKRFCEQGNADIVNASRPIRPAELAACTARDRDPIAFEIATDALTIVVSHQNDFLPKSLTLVELQQVLTAKTWADIDPDWPNDPIATWIPEPNSDEFNLLVEEVWEGDDRALRESPNVFFFNNEELLLAEALTNGNLIGIVGHGHYRKSADILRAVAISGINPDPRQDYPLTRPLFIYAAADDIQERPEIAGFIAYYLKHVSDRVEAAHYFPATPSALAASRRKLVQIQGEEP